MFSVGSCQLVLAHDSNDGQLACGGLSKHDDFLNSLVFASSVMLLPVPRFPSTAGWLKRPALLQQCWLRAVAVCFLSSSSLG